MNLSVLFIFFPMWAFSSKCLFFLVDAVHESTASGSSLLSQKETSSVLTPKMEARSPGTTEVLAVKSVVNKELNERILIALVVASTILGGILLFFLWFCIYRLKRSKNCSVESTQNPDSVEEHSLRQGSDSCRSSKTADEHGAVTVMDYQLLEAATNNFGEENIFGDGGHRCVYRAQFDEKRLVIVKRLEGRGQYVQREYENELNWLTKIQHQNIISLVGCCTHGENKFLVYEMMQNGSLEGQLHGPTRGSILTWQLRMKIAVDIARGLEYLHEHCHPPIVHGGLKSSTVLLDSNFNAKLSNFGTAAPSGILNSNVKLSGTLDYVAPEYLLDGKLTDKCDVYAFGVVLLELLTGRKPAESASPGSPALVTWALPQLTDRPKLPAIIDPAIKETMDLKHLYQVAAVAILCVQQEPSYRPLITDVLHSLIPLLPLELGGSLRVTEPVPSAPTL
ncbi:hypothetical protein K2173_019220 [Erythroxylum novogranatense]|uniref:Protein kinase domain-containing protein n=1 Tax=Erythroxylum novogranatense TaxID=1862640 RepID=A0AAV8SSZ1_9ROSI|nr:hypothetical protein K2173_019220 [Erythroxylum novogranatense]